MTDHNASGCGTDQHVRQCDRVYKRPSGRPGQEDFGGRLMMWIGGIQMRDEDARVHCDHAGQSARSSALPPKIVTPRR